MYIGIFIYLYDQFNEDMVSKLLIENAKVAAGAIKSNKLRTILTIVIITIGITALIGIITAVQSIETAISSNFTGMGANTFTIENRGQNIQIGKRKRTTKRHSFISYKEAQLSRNNLVFRQLLQYLIMLREELLLNMDLKKQILM
ncbi:ABC transporter permease [Saccharicrinis fermentans]|uniref:MacB-like periplasmic core domain-containing protein n=1 Tax=Saccharicrinis fermentans DSM 9555 = JCM 21142 TaxID=869213 RepID=W7Y6K5_9BACT|nr:ABC transporter permease [Saccharicrinis fermentans]GAF03847.1 hypothetical protein JCM21142_72534 [Saccharicrinis fermentans DSM 9555 = JCM 21142]